MTAERAVAVRKPSQRAAPARGSLLFGLVGLVALAAAPPFAVLLNVNLEVRRERGAMARDAALQQAQLMGLAVEQVVGAVHQTMVLVSGLDAGSPSCGERLDRLRSGLPELVLLEVLQPDGAPLCRSVSERFPPDAAPAIAAPLLQAASFTVGSSVATNGFHLMSFALPFGAANGGAAGVVIAGLDVAAIGAALRAVTQRPDAVSAVRDRNGALVARAPNDAPAFEPANDAGQEASRSGPPGSASSTRIVQAVDGMEWAFGYIGNGSDATGLSVGARVNVAGVSGGIDDAARRGTFLVLASMAASFLLALLFGQRYLRGPTAELLASARRWGKGDLSVRARTPSGAAGEVAQLGNAFNTMAELLQVQHSELQGLNEALEIRVADRTRALLASNNRLQVEIAERELSEAGLRQAQKLQAVGQLAGGMAHDFNNLLTVILGSIELLRKRMTNDPRQLRLLEVASRAVSRGSRLTSQLLSFSRKQPLLAVSVDLVGVIDGMTGLLASTLGPSVRIQSRVANDLWPVLLDPNQFETALLNLALNARSAMPLGGRLAISASNATVAPGAGPSGVAPGQYVRVVVSDSGHGMSKEVLSRAFEPFFTTRPAGAASGLGLSQVHGLMQQSGGNIAIESHPGEGAVVTLLLPRSESPPVQLMVDINHTVPALARDQSVLLVDDDEEVREVTALNLTESGYTVVVAASAEEGLAVLERQSAHIGLLIADHAMPGMAGNEMLDLVRRRWPRLPTLLATGYADLTGLTSEGLTLEQIVRKPFRLGELLARIEMVCVHPPAEGVEAGAA